MDNLELVEASKVYEIQAMEYRQEYINCGENEINGSSGLFEYENYDKWLEKIKMQKNIIPSSTETPSTTYFTLRKSDNKIIGSIQLRHHLTDELLKDGGNIGYGIRPSERGKGYGTQQVALVLAQAKGIGLSKVMISCNKINRASAQVAINNGGILAGEGFDEDEKEVTEIYWIEV
ncbi:MAG: GNAT family N-acetyltransferase [Defluviitaleaceae bacterium]|nr:GNAT family N-acetyltransferase [Defluviitaleaceae bacterium]